MDGDFLQFLGELPPVVPMLFIGFALIFIVALVLTVAPKGAKSSKRRTPQQRAKPDVYEDIAPAGDLPDLDLLVGNAPESPAAPSPAPRSPTPVTASAQVSSNGAGDIKTTRLVEVMTVLRGDDNQLFVRIDEQVYSTATPITDADTRKAFSGTMRDLVKLATDMPTAPKAVPASPPAKPLPAIATEPAEEDEPKPISAPPPVPRTGEVPGDLPMFSQMANEPLKFRGGKPKQVVPEIAVGSAIEAYLQYRLEHTPEFEGRSIHIHSSPSGGVTIDVDGRHYEAVRDVEDEAARNFLMTTIEEWQNRQ